MHRRTINFAGFFVCLALITFALYSQHVNGLDPCPLCILQRIAVIGVGVVFLLAAIHHPGRFGGRIYAALIVMTGGAGAIVAGRHVWLQSLPADQVPACGPGLDYILEVFPFSQALAMIFSGSGECAEVGWTFLGLSMPAWVLVWLLTLVGVGVWNNLRAYSFPAG